MGQGTAETKGTPFLEKLSFFSDDFLKLCAYLSEVEPSRETFTKRLYSKMVSSAKLLEDFLDFHGAKNSSKWFFYRELVSSVRNLAEASYSQKHIFIRLPFYDLPGTERFEEAGYATHKFLTSSLRAISRKSLEEAANRGIQLPEERLVWDDFPGIPTQIRLESDIDDENLREERKNIVRITTEFIRVSREFETHSFYSHHSLEEIEAIVPSRFNEEQSRHFEMIVHSLQSSFDTYVNRSGLQLRQQKLRSLRGHISVVLHLLELARRLLHYFERHLYEVGYKSIRIEVRNELAKAVDPEEILDRIVNYGLYYVCHFLLGGGDLAQELLNQNIETGTIIVGVPQKLGFHSRPSLLVAKVVQFYGGHVALCVGYDRFDASSVLDLQWAGGKIHKDGIQEVVFQGDTRALNDLQILASVNYGEDTMGKGIPLPKELSYLK